jgi:signal transduction histidine kinase
MLESMKSANRSLVGQVLIGTVPVGLFALLLWLFADDLGHRFPFFAFGPVILLAARYGGMLGGSIATVLSAYLIVYVWLSHIPMPLVVSPWTKTAAVFGFVAGGFFISFVHGRLSDRELELKRVLARERAASARAAEANRMKDEFLASLSHELRTPLNVVLGYVRMLRQQVQKWPVAGADAVQAHRILEVIERNGAAQMRLIEDLLDVQRIIAGKFTMEMAPLDLQHLGNTVVDSLRPAAEAKHLHWVTRIEPVRMRADAARLQQVLWNLLSNAIKFTPENGCVALHAYQAESSVVIRVEDSGEGIPADFLPHVFERFRQLDMSTTRRHCGMGLGLAIVKEVVERHGGTVMAHSDGEGKGARFIVTLPFGGQPAAMPSEAPASLPLSSEASRGADAAVPSSQIQPT